jgi:hypothetical protein
VPFVSDIKTLQFGPRMIIVALTVSIDPTLSTMDARQGLRETEDRVRSADPRIKFVYFGIE